MLLPKSSRYLLFFLYTRCEAFPTYPRTYDLVHGEGLLTLEFGEKQRCEMLDIFAEIDRVLRPEVDIYLTFLLNRYILLGEYIYIIILDGVGKALIYMNLV